MALQLRDTRSRFSLNLSATIVAVMALFVQPLVALNIPSAFATTGTPGSVVINEFSSSSNPEWVELYNTTATPVDVSGWHIKDSTTTMKVLSGTIAANGFKTLDVGSGYLNNDVDEISLLDNTNAEINKVAYGPAASAAAPSASQSAYRTTDGGSTWAVGTMTTKNGTNNPAPVATAVTNTRLGVTYDELQAAIDDATSGDTLRLNEDLSLSSDVDVTKSVVIDGNGKTITGNFEKTDGSNSSVLSILANGVTVRNVTVDGVNPTTKQLHGVNVYEATGVTIDNVTSRNFRSGVTFNSASGTVQNLTAVNNIWHDINVDQQTSQPANVIITGTNAHTGPQPDLYVDDDTRQVAVTAADYTWARSGLPGRAHDRVYTLNPPVEDCSNGSTFDMFTNGSVNDQNGWKVTGPYDQSIVTNIYGYESFGCKSLRISNAVTSGGFGDQTFSAPASTLAGESAENDRYEASFSFGSTKQVAQPGLALSVSPDDGTGNRMSYVGLKDTAAGTELTFYDTDASGNFKATPLGTVNRTEAHTIKFVIELKDGASNDVVKVYVDSSPAHTGTTWENYYRYSSEQAGNGNTVPGIDRLIFRAGGAAAPATENSGFLFDNVSVTTSKSDVIAPPAPSITKPAARQWFKTAPITTQWSSVTDPSGVHYQVAYHYDDNHGFNGSDCVGETINGQSVYCRNENNTSRNHSPGLNEEGGVTVWVRAIDGAGNTGPWSESVHYYYDHTAPTTTIVAPTDTVGSGFTVSGVAKDNLALNRVYVQLVNRENSQRYGGTTINLIGNGTNAEWSKTFDANALNLPDGHYAAHVSVVDMAGNTGSAGWTVNFTVDTTAPAKVNNLALYDNSGVVTSGFTNDYSVTVRWNAVTDAQKYEYCYYNDVPTSIYREGDCYTTYPTNNQQSGALNQGEGTHFVKVRAIDAAGNKGEWSNTLSFVYDKTAPVVTVSEPTRNSDGTYTVTGTNSESSPVDVFLDGVEKATVQTNNGTWTYTTATPINDGAHTFSASSTDAAGNTSPARSSAFTASSSTGDGNSNNNNSGAPGDPSSSQPAGTNRGPGSVAAFNQDRGISC